MSIYNKDEQTPKLTDKKPVQGKLEPIKDIMQEAFNHIEVYEQLNANRTYFYGANEPAKRLLTLMQRKTFVRRDIPRIKNFLRSMGIKNPVIKTVAVEKPL